MPKNTIQLNLAYIFIMWSWNQYMLFIFWLIYFDTFLFMSVAKIM